jgi:hypothetical protein
VSLMQLARAMVRGNTKTDRLSLLIPLYPLRESDPLPYL